MVLVSKDGFVFKHFDPLKDFPGLQFKILVIIKPYGIHFTTPVQICTLIVLLTVSVADNSK